MADTRWDEAKPLVKEALAIPSSREGLLNGTYRAKQALRAGDGLPKNLQGNQLDLVTHYTYSRALEEGGHNLDEKEVIAMGENLSKRMDATIRILERTGELEKMPFGFRKIDSNDSFSSSKSVVHSPSMDMFIIKDSHMADGVAKRRIFKSEEFYERYEPPEEWK